MNSTNVSMCLDSIYVYRNQIVKDSEFLQKLHTSSKRSTLNLVRFIQRHVISFSKYTTVKPQGTPQFSNNTNVNTTLSKIHKFQANQADKLLVLFFTHLILAVQNNYANVDAINLLKSFL